MQDLMRPAEMWVREALQLDIESGVGGVFSSSFIEEFATITGVSREQIASYQLSQLLDWRYQYTLQHYLRQKQARKRAVDFLAYVERQGFIRRIALRTWELTLDIPTMQVRPREVGYDQSPLVYAWNELQEILGV